jgi:hypothetical protein
VDGSVDENWMKGAIEFTQKTLGGPGKEVLPSQVFDFKKFAVNCRSMDGLLLGIFGTARL